MLDDTTNTEQSRVAADCPNERLVMCSRTGKLDLHATVKANNITVREYLERHLDAPGDPYGLGDAPEYLVQYMAPIADEYRFEQCRRLRVLNT